MELAKIGRLNPQKVVNLDEATVRADALPEELAVVASVKVKRFPTKDGEGIGRAKRALARVLFFYIKLSFIHNMLIK